MEWFGVANLAEAQEIASLAAGNRILVLGPALGEERAALVGGGFTPVISDFEEARAYAGLAGKNGVGVHLAVDSGMGRLGVWETEAVELAKAFSASRDDTARASCGNGAKSDFLLAHGPAARPEEVRPRQA